MPLIGGVVTQANVGDFFAPDRSDLDAPHYFRYKMNGLMLVKDMMLELDQIANFNTEILSHCANSTIEIPVTVDAPFVH